MEFCPTKQERYAASLRQLMLKRILKMGFNRNSVEQLKKICMFESVNFDENGNEAFEISEMLDVLLSAVFIRLTIRGINAKTKNSAYGCHFVNKKLFEIIMAFISTSCAVEDNVLISADKNENFLIIVVNGLKIHNDIKKAAALMKGGCIREIKSEKYLIYLPIKSASFSEKYYPSDAFIILSKGFQ